MKRFAPLLLPIFLWGCQEDSHPAQGRWNGVLINNGQRVEVGQVYIGEDRIDIPQIDESYRHLAFTLEGDRVRFARKTGNFQGEGSTRGNRTSGSIRLNDDGEAELQVSQIQGVVRLSR